MSAVANSLTGFRFVWRYRNQKRWFVKTFSGVTVEREALAAMQRHIEQSLKQPLSDVVVDHVFYGLRKADEEGLAFADPLSLCDRQHPFYIEFANRVQPPPAPQ